MFQILDTFLSLFFNKMLLFRAGIYKMLVRIATASDCSLHCLSRPLWQVTNV